MAEILVVDDEIGIRELLSEILVDEGHSVYLAENAAAARALRHERCPDLVLLDIWMPDMDGISLLKEWSAGGMLTMPVVMMSGHGTIDTAVEATRIGAVGFLEKPIALQKLLEAVKKALMSEYVGQQTPVTLDGLVHMPVFRDLKKRLEQTVAKANTLFIRGATGPVVEVCARTLQRPQAPWLDLAECTAPINQELLQKLSGGVIYVHDVASLGKLQQMNLVFVLERVSRHNILLVLASSQPLQNLVARGWDSQVINRLSEVWLALPGLGQHGGELPEVMVLLLAQMVKRNEVPQRCFSSQALESLQSRRWGAEISWADIQALVRNLALTALDKEISGEDIERLLPEFAETELASEIPESLSELFAQPLREARDAFERYYFEHLLRMERGNMTRVADRSGLERTHLYRKLKQLGVAVGRRNEETRL